MMGRRSSAVPDRTASIKPHHWNAELPRLVGEIGTDAVAGEHDDADRHRLKHAGRCA